MNSPTAAALATIGHEADASIRGYNYQAHVAAIEWCLLDESGELHLEIAEDVAISGPDGLRVIQVKDVARRLTVRSAHDFLNRVVDQLATASGHVHFHYLTTASFGADHQCSIDVGRSALKAWNESNNGAGRSVEVVTYLRSAARPGSSLATWLLGRTDSDVVDSLLRVVHWDANSPSLTHQAQRLTNEVATFCLNEFGLESFRGRQLGRVVVGRVKELSAAPDAHRRVLRRQDLRDLLLTHAKVSLEPREYAAMARAARLARQVPVELLTQQLVNRLDDLRVGRFFPELDAVTAARALARDASDDGSYALASAAVRSEVLAWCARLTVHHDAEAALALLSESESVAKNPQQRLVRALIEAESDVPSALRTLRGIETPDAMTVRYIAIRRTSPDAAVKWLGEETLTPADFDQDGQFIVLVDALRRFEWEFAFNWLESIDRASLPDHPALTWAAGQANYYKALPPYLREWAFDLRPTVIDEDLRSTPDAIAAIQDAIGHLDALEGHCRARGWIERADLALEHSLWLKMRHPDTSFVARRRATELFERDVLSKARREPAFRWLPLALAAGQDVDTSAILSRAKSYAKLYVELDENAAWALFALMQHMSPEDVLAEWSFLYDALHKLVHPVQLSAIKVQVLARTGDRAAAEALLAEAALPDEVAEQLRAIYLSDVAAADSQIHNTSPSARREIARRQKSCGDSALAIQTLEEIYAQTSALSDACNLVRLLLDEGQFERAADVLNRLDDTFAADPRIARLHVRLSVQQGDWQRALACLDHAELEDHEVLQQRAQLAIQSVDWDQIPALLQDAVAVASGDARVLLEIATIATTFGLSGIAQRACEAAVALSSDHPSTLMSAYMLAVKGNWAEKSSASDWMLQAVAKNDQVPEQEQVLQRKSLQELVALAPRWNERARALGEMVQAAELFLAMLADANNETLTSILCLAMRRNAGMADPADRQVIPLYAGTGRALQIASGARAALDATSLLVFAYLDVLDTLPQVFGQVYLPHDFGLWLLNERDRIGFHQPSRVVQANDLIRWIAKRDIGVVPAKVRRGALYKEVGRELADLINVCNDAAEEAGGFVVHPYPIYSVGSSMTRVAELPPEVQRRLISVRGLVRTLSELGLLSTDEMARAEAFLDSHDAGWQLEAAAPPGSTLYIDGLALTYLRSLGLIERCIAGRFKLFIHEETSREAIALASHQEDSAYPRELISKLQKFVHNGFKNGFIRSLPASRPDPEDEGDRLATRLLKQLFVDIPPDAILVIDDRAGNRHISMTDARGQDHAVASSLDVLDRLRELGVLSDRDHLAKRALLRDSGCALIPVRPDEARRAAEELTVVEGEVRESYFARTLRESMQLLKVSRILALPLEESWLTSTASACREAITSLWSSSGDSNSDRADWLFDLGRFSEFSASFLGDFDARRGLMQEALEVARYLIDPSQGRDHEYWTWVDTHLCQPLRENRPAAFGLLLEVLKAQLLRLKNEDSPEIVTAGETAQVDLALIAAGTLSTMPKTVRGPLLEDETFCDALGISVTRQTTAHTASRPTFDTDALYAATAQLVRDGACEDAHIVDDHARVWRLLRQEEDVIAQQTELSEEFEVTFAPLFSDRSEIRVEHMKQLVAQVGADARFELSWGGRLASRALEASDVAELRRELRMMPLVTQSRIADAFRANSVHPQELVPVDESYFLTLSGLSRDQATLPLAAGALVPWGSSVSRQDQLRLSLFRSIHSRFAPVGLLNAVSTSEFQEWTAQWSSALDVWSLVGLIEGLCQCSRDADELAPILRPLLVQATSALATDSARMRLATALAAFVDQRVALAGLLGFMPPSARRLASFSHAALLESEVLDAEIDLESFIAWLEQFQTPFHAVSLADVHSEPRWSAVFLSPTQLAYELTGRVVAALGSRDDIVGVAQLKEVLEGPESLTQRHHMVYGGLPGPLEGSSELEQDLPDALQDELREALDAPGASLADGLRLAGHAGMLGRLAPDVVRRINDALGTLIDSDSALLGTGDGGQAYVMLCHVAASLRDIEMARLLSRAITEEESMSTGLAAYLQFLCCAAYPDRVQWAKALDSVAYQLSRDDRSASAAHAHFILQSICAVRTDILPLVVHRIVAHRR